MKTYKNIEELFSDKLQNYAEQPPEDLWNNIESKTGKTKSGSRMSKFIITSIIFITSALVLFFAFDKNEQTKELAASFSNPQLINGMVPEEENSSKNEDTHTDKENRSITNVSDDNTETVSAKTASKPEQDKNIIIRTSSENSRPESLNGTKKLKSFAMKDCQTREEIESESEVDTAELNYTASALCSQTEGCAPLTIRFKSLNTDAESVNWDFGNGTKTDTRRPTVTFEKAGTYIVRYTAFYSNNSTEQLFRINVKEKPGTDFIIENDRQVFRGDELTFANLSSGNYQYRWDFGDGHTSAQKHPKHRYAASGIYDVSLSVQAKNGCTDKAVRKNLVVKDNKYKIQAPTAFSPNTYGANDGRWKQQSNKNEIFFPIIKSELSEYHLRIFNRSGMLIFESKNYEVGWNGYINDKLAANQVYVWECYGKFDDGEPFRETGNITLVY